jgi:glycosyltransferase involved in cell wall biosynthesis
MGDRLRVGMIGPGLDVPGGMTAVHRTWLRSRAFDSVDVDYFESMGEGNFLEKLGKNILGQSRFIRELAQGYRPDVFHIHVADRRSFYRKLAYFEEARLTGVPVVVHIHGAVFEAFYEAHPANAVAVNRMFARADKVLVLHQKIYDKSIKWAGSPDNVEILYNPVELDVFGQSETRPETRPPTVLMMGEIGERKGAFDLIEAIPAVLAEVPDAYFRFAGNGETDTLQDRANALGIADNVDVMGWTAGEDKIRAFQTADVYCLPSYAENLPVSILEAMAARLPVVGTPVAGTPEEIIEDETGFMIEPGDKPAMADRLIRLLKDQDLRERMGAAGRARAEAHFDNEVVCTRLIRLWREAITARTEETRAKIRPSDYSGGSQA